MLNYFTSSTVMVTLRYRRADFLNGRRTGLTYIESRREFSIIFTVCLALGRAPRRITVNKADRLTGALELSLVRHGC